MLCLGHINASVVGKEEENVWMYLSRRKKDWKNKEVTGKRKYFVSTWDVGPQKEGQRLLPWFQHRRQGWSPRISFVPGWMQGTHHPALRSSGSRVNHLPVRKQPTVTSHHSGTRGRIKARRSPCFRPQLCSKTLAVRRLRSLSSRKLHFISAPWLFTHHRAGLGPLLPSWLRLYTKHHFLLPRKRTIHSHSYIPLWA